MKKIKYLVKYSKILYNVYFYTLSLFLRILGLFVKTDSKMILFNSFGGRKYDDSPRVIFEQILEDKRFEEFKLIWAVNNPDNFNIPQRAKVIKDYSLKFFFYALKARVWITNSSMEHGLCFKKKSTIYINTWHGSAIKYLGNDAKKEGGSFKSKGTSKATAFYTQSEFDEYVFKRAFHIDESTFKRFGLPRNDELVGYTRIATEKIKSQLHLPEDKKIVLYAPTFREYSRNSINEITQEMRIDLKRWDKEMGDRYILLVRVHYEVAKTLDFVTYNSVFNVSDYPHLNDLMIISDLLISDYSSIYFDYSILHRPMLCFAYDIDEYIRNRGMYIDIRKELPCSIVQSEEELFSEIHRVFEEYKELCKKTVKFQEKYVSEYGSAAKKTCDYLTEILS